MANDALERLVTAVAHSNKYKHIDPELVRFIGERELVKRSSFKAALKGTKNKLHQVGGAYFEATPDYNKAFALLQETIDSPSAFQASCRQIMRWHSSTRERLPILDQFYATILAELPPINHVIDIACGLNPLAWPWMPFAPQTSYHAYDIYADEIHFLQRAMDLMGINGRAQQRDVLQSPPTETADLALILKTVPCLEQLDKQAMPRLLDALNARALLISYPVATLGGRQKGMAATYEAHFHALAAQRPWHIQRFQFPTELVFLVTEQ